MKIFGAFTKVEDQEDGTIKVWGYASSESVDSDGETILASAIENSLVDYMKFGAVREMHQPLAAGTAIEASVQDDGRTWFGAHVVDPIAVKKIQTEVYKGFSIGGKVLKRDPLNKTVITELKLVEVSLVDRPANPEAVFTMYKADGIEDKPADVDTPAVINPEPTDIVVEKTESVSIKKGLSTVSEFACLLRNLGYLVSEAAWEAEYEGDASPIPKALLQWLADGAVLFQAMAAEEIAELTASLTAHVSTLPEVILLSEKTDDLNKAGAKFSATSKTALAALHKMAADMNEGFAKLGYDAKDEDDKEEEESDKEEASEKADDVEDLQKSDDINKGLTEEISKVSTERDLLKAELETLKKSPAVPKAAINSFAVAKENDVVKSTSSESDKDLPPVGTEERALHEIKKVLGAGGKRLV